MEIRLLTAEDIERVLDLERETPEAPHWGWKIYEDFVAETDSRETVRKVAWVATEKAELVGFAAVQMVLDVCDLESIVVTEQARRRGVGRALFDVLTGWAQEQGARRIQLEVRSGNTTAIRFYERAGLRREGLRSGYYQAPEEDAVLMGLEFSPGRLPVENFQQKTH